MSGIGNKRHIKCQDVFDKIAKQDCPILAVTVRII